MGHRNLSEHISELLDELAYWRREPTAAGWDLDRRKIAEDDCRKELELAASLLRQHGF